MMTMMMMMMVMMMMTFLSVPSVAISAQADLVQALRALRLRSKTYMDSPAPHTPRVVPPRRRDPPKPNILDHEQEIQSLKRELQATKDEVRHLNQAVLYLVELVLDFRKACFSRQQDHGEPPIEDPGRDPKHDEDQDRAQPEKRDRERGNANVLDEQDMRRVRARVDEIREQILRDCRRTSTGAK